MAISVRLERYGFVLLAGLLLVGCGGGGGTSPGSVPGTVVGPQGGKVVSGDGMVELQWHRECREILRVEAWVNHGHAQE